MAPITWKPSHRVFFEAHREYFQALHPEITGRSFPKAYPVGGEHSAKAIWASYEGDHAELKAPYITGAEKDNFSYEPPLASNDWQGAAKATPAQEPDGGEPGTEPTVGAPDVEPTEQGPPGPQPGSGNGGAIPGPSAQALGKRKASDVLDESAPQRPRLPPGQVLQDFPRDPGELPHNISLPTFLHGGLGTLGGKAKFNLFDYNEKELLAGEVPKNFVNETPADEDGYTWSRKAKVGAGSFGAVSKWVLTDGAGNVKDTIVIKDCPMLQEWTNITTWTSDRRDTLREVAVHRILSPRPGAAPETQHFITYRGSRLCTKLKFYRIGMQEARLKDLEMLAVSLNPVEDTFRQKTDDGPQITDYTDAGYQWLPTSFIWELFATLIDGLAYMHQENIVHRDFKGPNVFLDMNDEEESPLGRWGIRALIADYGTCMPKQAQRYSNPDDFDGQCTVPLNAPEQWVYYPPVVADSADPEMSYPIGEKADVFALGMMMWLIIQGGCIPGKTAPRKPTRRQPNPPKVRLPWNRAEEIRQLYDPDTREMPEDVPQHIQDYLEIWDEEDMGQRALYKHWQDTCPNLIAIIKECLQWDPQQRPDFETLAERVRTEIAALDASVDVGLDKGNFFQHLRPKEVVAAPAQSAGGGRGGRRGGRGKK